VAQLRQEGIEADILLCRTDRPLSNEIKNKIGLFCNLERGCVFTAQDAPSIYEVPMNLHREGVDEKIVERLGMWTSSPNVSSWTGVAEKIHHPKQEVTIGMVGKYMDLKESYKSVNEAVFHGGLANNCKVNVEFIDSEDMTKEGTLEKALSKVDGILVPGGFGERGTEGMVSSARYARENKKPYFGICLGLQIAVIEYSRNVVGWKDAASAEFNPESSHLVIDIMEDQKNVEKMGGTMRLGAWECELVTGTKAFDAYKKSSISERHRHRFEVSNKFRDEIAAKGMIFSGYCRDPRLQGKGGLVEMIELKDHPYFVGCQFHPEFKSKPLQPHPLFSSFIAAAIAQKNR